MVADLGVAGVAAAEPARPLLAAVVPAARVLAEVAADRALVAQERRGGEAGGRRDCRVRRRASSSRELGQRRRRADPQTVAVAVDTAEPGVLEVDEQRRRADAAVDLSCEIGAAGEHGCAARAPAARAPRRPRSAARSVLTRAPRARGRASAAARRRAGPSRARTRSRSPQPSGRSAARRGPSIRRSAGWRPATCGKSITISGTSAIVGIL